MAKQTQFLDDGENPLVEGAYYYDPKRNNVSTFHKILVVRKIEDGRVEIMYPADRRSDSITFPGYTRNTFHYFGGRERISAEIKALETLLANFRKEVAEPEKPSHEGDQLAEHRAEVG